MFMSINLFMVGLNLLSPYLIAQIIDYIETKDNPRDAPSLERGILFVLLLILSQGLFFLMSEHLDYSQKIFGVKLQNAVIAMLYRKQLKLSSATNKSFSSGEVVNFIQVDAAKIQYIPENLIYVSRYPVVIVGCFIMLFDYIGISFLAGVAVFVVAFFVNTYLTKISANLQGKYMAAKDERLNIQTESLNNIKMLKLYSWTD